MKAPVSKLVRRILSDRTLAREFARQTISSQRGGDGLIEVDGQTYRIERVTQVSADGPCR